MVQVPPVKCLLFLSCTTKQLNLLFKLPIEPPLAVDCKWCSGLPQRLKQLHSHWLSRSTGAVILRGVPYDDHAIHFILAPADDPEAPARHCLVVPSHRQVGPNTSQAHTSTASILNAYCVNLNYFLSYRSMVTLFLFCQHVGVVRGSSHAVEIHIHISSLPGTSS